MTLFPTSHMPGPERLLKASKQPSVSFVERSLQAKKMTPAKKNVSARSNVRKRSPSLRFRHSLTEVNRLLEIHSELTGTASGRRRNVAILHKSSVLFLCAAFEAFIEILATEAFHHIVAEAAQPSVLPVAIRRSIALALRDDRNELAPWALAAEGWRVKCDTHKEIVVRKFTGTFNSPKPHNIDLLLKELIGLDDITSHWQWRGMQPALAISRLKDFVQLRGALAHSEEPAPVVNKADVIRSIGLLSGISVRSSNVVGEYCEGATGRSPWPVAKYKSIK